ncbi:MAG: hypothetical protein AAGE65_11565 [Planctomycetota bacterium]
MLGLRLMMALVCATPLLARGEADEPIAKSPVESLLDAFAQHGDADRAGNEAGQWLAEVALTRRTGDLAAFADAGYAAGLVALLDDPKVAEPAAWLARLRARPVAARELAFLFDPHGDDAARVLGVFGQLDDAFGADLDAFPGLAAALCVVHDRDIERRVNENQVRATDPVALFRFFRDHEKQMLFGMRDVPGALLVWVVDSTASIEEMRWALDNHAGDRAVGRRFFDIRYDYAHFRNGAPKRVTVEGFSLPNILQYGGVCADQAYYAVQVGKAIGVPAAYTIGRGGDVSHAWVGYFEQQGRGRGGWNFNEGRYASYQGVRGVTEHPQTGKWVDDSFVSVLAEAITLPPTQRYAASAMVRAATLLGSIADQPDGQAMLDALVEASSRPAVRSASLDDRLGLIEAGLRIDVGLAEGWLRVAELAEGGRLSTAQQRKWSQSLVRLCGQRYPDFMVTVLRPILGSVDDVAEQSRQWAQAMRQVRGRNDLSAEILMIQGGLWEHAGDLRRAADYYEDIVRRFANGGPYVLQALERFEQLLTDAGRPERVVVLYREAFRELDVPQRMAADFARQSNYFRVGSRYVEKLREAGDTRTAEKIAAKIQQQTGLAAGG